MNQNFDTRRRIYQLPAWQVDMVDTARREGATATFAGSGGAIIGTYQDEAQYCRIEAALRAIGSRTIKPLVTAT